ncbi:MAG TPA: hypothetical protein PKW95_16545 [bacterium]|nr:hypothetical protein [bacterium]
MKIKIVSLLLIASVVLALSILPIACSGDDDDDDDDNDGEAPPTKYDLSMIGWGFGDGIFRYQGGQWQKETVSSVTFPIVAAKFQHRLYGYVITSHNIYRFNNEQWSTVTPPDLPNTVNLFDIAVTSDGTYWFGGNDAQDNGYLVRILPDGTRNVIAMTGTITTQAAKLSAILTVPEDAALHMTALIEGHWQHVRWDGSNVSSDVIVAYSEEAPTQVNDIALAPDGAFWAVGWDITDGEKIGVFWRRGNESWSRRAATPVSTCKTTDVRKLQFTADGAGYAIADCLWSQIYMTTDSANWSEMELPGIKGDQFLIQDMDMLEANRGWAVGYNSDWDEPLLLLRQTGGWQQARPVDEGSGNTLNAVAIFDIPQPVDSDDDTVDDDTADDDTADDDVTDDDLADDDAQ